MKRKFLFRLFFSPCHTLRHNFDFRATKKNIAAELFALFKRVA